MSKVRLGRTEICVNKNGFGALPVQRVSLEEAAYLLKKAYQGGIRFFDTARAYSDSEEKIGYALSDVRKTLFISSKTTALTAEQFWKDLQTSLTKLKTDYLDILQFHNPPFCPKPGDESGLYDAILEARHKGMVRFVGFTNHRLAVAQEAVESGLYDTLQFPFSYLADEKEVELVKLCEKKDVGFIAMKALSGGLITNSAAAYAYLDQYPNVLPIWGVQRESELDEFLSYINCPPALTQELKDVIDRDRSELVGDFCRGCGYCLPCPAEIDIPTCARMSLLLRRAPAAQFLTEESRQKMARIENCIHCGHCENHCPYGLKTPELLRKNYEDYKSFF